MQMGFYGMSNQEQQEQLAALQGYTGNSLSAQQLQSQNDQAAMSSGSSLFGGIIGAAGAALMSDEQAKMDVHQEGFQKGMRMGAQQAGMQNLVSGANGGQMPVQQQNLGSQMRPLQSFGPMQSYVDQGGPGPGPGGNFGGGSPAPASALASYAQSPAQVASALSMLSPQPQSTSYQMAGGQPSMAGAQPMQQSAPSMRMQEANQMAPTSMRPPVQTSMPMRQQVAPQSQVAAAPAPTSMRPPVQTSMRPAGQMIVSDDAMKFVSQNEGMDSAFRQHLISDSGFKVAPAQQSSQPSMMSQMMSLGKQAKANSDKNKPIQPNSQTPATTAQTANATSPATETGGAMTPDIGSPTPLVSGDNLGTGSSSVYDLTDDQANAVGSSGADMGAAGMDAGMADDFASDRRLKTKIRRTLADDFLDYMHPKSYQYKKASDEPRPIPTGGKYLGVMAQDLERIPQVGHQLVVDTPRGKMVAPKAALSAALAGLGRLNERVRLLEDHARGGK
jgi:hypothetical protein